MKICHVITRMIVGGAQENTLLTIKGHLQKGHDVTLVTGPTTGPEGELLKFLDIKGLMIHEIPSLVREISPINDISTYLTLKKFFLEQKFDVVHTHSSKAGIIGRFASWAAKVPFVVHTVHGQAFHQYEKKWKNLIYIYAERLAARKCHKIYAVAQAMIEQCVCAKIADRSKYMVVYSGMELEPFLNHSGNSELRRKLGIPENAPIVGSIARLFPLKGYEYFVPAAVEIAKSVPDVFFLIVGDGTLMEKIHKEAKEKKLNFVFAGLVSPKEIPDYCSAMDILMHLSVREGLPRTVVQALASGIPAIGFNLDGTPEVILHGKTGYLANPGDSLESAKFAIELLKNKELAQEMGRNGRNLVKKRFDWKEMSYILEKEYIQGLNSIKQI